MNESPLNTTLINGPEIHLIGGAATIRVRSLTSVVANELYIIPGTPVDPGQDPDSVPIGYVPPPRKLVRPVRQQPRDQLDYDIDFTDWLYEGDFMVDAYAYVDIEGELEAAQCTVANRIVKVWVRYGIDAQTYKVSLVATSNQGRIKEVDFKVRIKDY